MRMEKLYLGRWGGDYFYFCLTGRAIYVNLTFIPTSQRYLMIERFVAATQVSNNF